MPEQAQAPSSLQAVFGVCWPAEDVPDEAGAGAADVEPTGAEATGAEATGAEGMGAEAADAEAISAESTGAEAAGAEALAVANTPPTLWVVASPLGAAAPEAKPAALP